MKIETKSAENNYYKISKYLYKQLLIVSNPAIESFFFLLNHTLTKINYLEIYMTTAQPKVIVFSTPTCSFCVQAKRYFKEKNIRFTDIDVSRDQSAARDMMRRTGQMGVPVILINNTAIVGFDRNKINQMLNIKN